MKIIHLISGLGQGGAETVLSRLVTNSTFDHIVISFTDEGVLGDTLRKAGIPVYTLGMNPRKVRLKDWFSLVRLLKSLQADVIQTWMYHADVLGGVAARFAHYRHISWGIRNSGMHLKSLSKKNYYLARLGAYLSRFIPQKIVVCGEQAAKIHHAWGYQLDKMRIIQNGYDFQKWNEDPLARQNLRAQWGLDENIPIMGFVARWHPLKDHPRLLEAFAMVKKSYPLARLVLVGKGLDAQNQELMRYLHIHALHVDKDVLLLGQRQDVVQIMSALDFHVLSSLAEGFPNVVSESMACRTPNIVTDVGDAALIVGDKGWVAKVANTEDLAKKMLEALDFLANSHANPIQQKSMQALRDGARERILEQFSLEAMVKHYETLWKEMVSQ